MAVMTERVEHRPLRAPRDDGAALVEPPPAAAALLVRDNVSLAESYDCDIQGRSLRSLARQARSALLQDALNYTRSYRDAQPAATGDSARVLLAGHQPQLFHPGVWFKNFALGRMAARLGATAVNLVIDSDTLKSPGVRVPGGTPQRPTIENVLYDRPMPETAYEERQIADRDTLVSFGARAAKTIEGLVPDPLLKEFWPLVVRRAEATSNLGECIAQARHQLEQAWGLETLELPQSHVCNLEAFYWFACHAIAQLPRLWDAYNSAVSDYRHVNRIRSRSHPVPDLASDGQWLEAPFWIWTAEDPRRRRVFVRQRGDELVLSDRHKLEVALPLTIDGDASRAVTRLAELSAGGLRLRTRALITTMFARVFLGDAFLHGIGGAKYDEVTDILVSRFFGIEPPRFITVTATLRLPVPLAQGLEAEARQIDQRMRELTYHPERYVTADGDARLRELAGTKRQWIETEQTPANALQRCRAIRSANAELATWTEPERRELVEKRQQLAQRLHSEAILASRDFAFCLYPAAKLRRLMDQA